MSPSPVAFAYHGVGPIAAREDPAGLFTTPGRFRAHIRWLRRWGYQFVTFSELAERVRAGTADGLCSLTFDDGFAMLLDHLMPILDEERVPATVFVVSTWLGVSHPDAPFARTLDVAGIREMSDAGVEIGSHSATHRDLSVLSHDEACADLVRSRDELQAIVGRPVTVAAYPYGRRSPTTVAACRDAGFTAACCIAGEGSWDDPFQIPRQDMHEVSTALGLWLKTHDQYEPVVRRLPGRAVRSAIRRTKKAVS